MKAKNERDQKFLKMLLSVVEDYNYETKVYSGRGMYGEQCIGVIVEDDSQIALIAYQLGICDAEEQIAASYIDRMKSDSLGLNTIVYWPSVKVEDDEEEAA